MTTFTVSNVERHADGTVWSYGKVTIAVAGAAYDSNGAFIGGESPEQTDASGLATFANLTVGVVYTWTHADGSQENFTAGSAGTYVLDALITTAGPAAPGAVTQASLAAAVAAAVAGLPDTAVLEPVASYTYNTDGTVATETIGGVATTYAYNADGTVHTATRAGVTRTFAYNSDGTIGSVS